MNDERLPMPLNITKQLTLSFEVEVASASHQKRFFCYYQLQQKQRQQRAMS